MSGSVYLSGGDLSVYGVPTATAAQIKQASDIIDTYLARPEGLVWGPDAQGNPAYMVAPVASATFITTGPLSPGKLVTVGVSGPLRGIDMLGQVLLLDRGNAGSIEACAVNSYDPIGMTVQLTQVNYPHASGITAEAGLTLFEEREMPAKRSVTRVTKSPLVALLSGTGQYAYGRRSSQVAGMYNDVNLIAALQTFGGPPKWIPFSVDPTQGASISPGNNEIWVPAGLLLAYYTNVRLWYIAGYSAASLPSPIKQACAAIVQQMIEFPEVSASFKKVQAGGTAIERWQDSVLSTDTKGLLESFRAKVFV